MMLVVVVVVVVVVVQYYDYDDDDGGCESGTMTMITQYRTQHRLCQEQRVSDLSIVRKEEKIKKEPQTASKILSLNYYYTGELINY